ncbi:hypothetical protein INS49_000348 [Diaporthe citri]|uniref:uncharacterized protein n=1 Tax=Diaporthe citri TaxID=83186 RepID=UPI001C82557E|nr:uncharacterized protein INS49_000348 [Diaporthe citri]KAG6366172.1 hypothetical protein INS49_000348 [Diaporthe citri]
MPRSLPPNNKPQQASRHGGDNGLAPLEGPSETPGKARRFSFFDFPPEIRNMIYHYSLHRPDCADLYRGYYRQAAALPRAQRWHRAHLRTPTILLLCRRITAEGMPVLRAQWFVIDRLPPCMPPTPDGKGGFLRMSNFIGRETLQRLHYIDLRVGLGEGPLGSGWIWNRVLDELVGILSERNALVHFRLLIRRCNQEDSPSVWATERTEEGQIRKVCACLFPELVVVGTYFTDMWRKKITGFQMSNPNIFRPGKLTVETWRIEGQKATFLAGHHQTKAEEGSEPPCRTYPDRELFPGSIMQFVDALPEADWSDEE